MSDLTAYIELKHSKKLVEYNEAIEFMESRVNQIALGSNKQLLWFLEHPPIYTAGTGSDMKDLLNNEISVHNSGRGGKITYHGPGQRVVYLMLDLKQIYKGQKPDLHKFVHDLERWIIASLEELGVKSYTKPKMIGIWTKSNEVDTKIAAIGIRVRKWVSYHGIAINVNPDMNYFKGIIPCGISEFGVTSLKELGIEVPLQSLDEILSTKFKEIFL